MHARNVFLTLSAIGAVVFFRQQNHAQIASEAEYKKNPKKFEKKSSCLVTCDADEYPGPGEYPAPNTYNVFTTVSASGIERTAECIKCTLELSAEDIKTTFPKIYNKFQNEYAKAFSDALIKELQNCSQQILPQDFEKFILKNLGNVNIEFSTHRFRPTQSHVLLATGKSSGVWFWKSDEIKTSLTFFVHENYNAKVFALLARDLVSKIKKYYEEEHVLLAVKPKRK